MLLSIGKDYNKRVQDNYSIIHAVIDGLRHAGRISTYRGKALYPTI